MLYACLRAACGAAEVWYGRGVLTSLKMRVASSLSGHGSFTAGWCGSVAAFATEAHAPIPNSNA